jgi:hypothetical protein
MWPLGTPLGTPTRRPLCACVASTLRMLGVSAAGGSLGGALHKVFCSRCSRPLPPLAFVRRLFLCRLFLRLKLVLKIPVLALVDADPYGLKILSVYMKGGVLLRWGLGWAGSRPPGRKPPTWPEAAHPAESRSPGRPASHLPVPRTVHTRHTRPAPSPPPPPPGCT